MTMPNEIYKKMADIMKDVGAIGKSDKNQSQGFNFRGIDTVYNEMHNILAKHRVFMTPEVIDTHHEERQSRNGGCLIYRIYTIRYTFYTEDGSSVSCVVMGEGMDSGDKAGNKALSIAHKYALLQCFCIPTAETKDPDAESHEVAPNKPPVKPPKKTTELADAVQWFALKTEIEASDKTVEDMVALLQKKGVSFDEHGKPDFSTFPLEYIAKIRNGLKK